MKNGDTYVSDTVCIHDSYREDHSSNEDGYELNDTVAVKTLRPQKQDPPLPPVPLPTDPETPQKKQRECEATYNLNMETVKVRSDASADVLASGSSDVSDGSAELEKAPNKPSKPEMISIGTQTESVSGNSRRTNGNW